MSTRPVLAGFHPDPSICRVGDEYFLANSSFEYVPGVPIHRSTDLVTWELVGHAVPDPAVVHAAPGAAGASQGIFAPTIRHHDGRFWLATTSIADVQGGQLIVHAEDPAGPWTEPVHVPGTLGIDPDLSWDDEGRCLLTWRGFGPPGIHQVEIDPMTGERQSEATFLWAGTGLADAEGPHLIRRGEWWYLLVAEGGTHTGHAVSVARSRSPRGPFEGCPSNPILSHRSTEHPVQATGHADLVERADGSWAMMHLGIRQAGSFPRFHTLGRETFLAEVAWVDEWPVVSEPAVEPEPPARWTDEFDGPLDARWVAPSVAPGSFAVADAGLDLVAGRPVGEEEQLHVLCTRLQAHEWEAVVELTDGDACASVRIDALHWVGLERVSGTVRARYVSAPFDQIMDELPVPERGPVTLVLRAEPSPGGFASGQGPDTITLALASAEGDREWVLASVDGRYVSTELAGGFTGRMLGLEALGGDCRIGSVSVTYPGAGTDEEIR